MGKILPAAYLLAAGRIPAEDSLAAVVVTHDSHGQVINMCVRVVLSVGRVLGVDCVFSIGLTK